MELIESEPAKPKEEYSYSYMDQFYSGEDLHDIHKPHEEIYQQEYNHKNYEYGHYGDTHDYDTVNDYHAYNENKPHDNYADYDDYHQPEDEEHTANHQVDAEKDHVDDTDEIQEMKHEEIHDNEEMVDVDIKNVPTFSNSEETQATLVVFLTSSYVNKAYQSAKEKEQIAGDEQQQENEDPYKNTVEEEAILDYYDQMNMGSMPEFDRSFEFEPKFEPKSLEDYTKDPHENLVFLKEFPTYTKEMVFRFKGIKLA